MKMCSCGTDAYSTLWAEKGILWCWKCKSAAGIGSEPRKTVLKKAKVDRMPDKIEELSARKWNKIRPWKKVGFDLVERFGFYLSELHGRVKLKNGNFADYSGVYLVMPVTREGEQILFSARLIDGNEHAPKYVIPTNIQKNYWLSDTPKLLTKQKLLVFLCEGIADAAYLSPLGFSVGLLGVNYDGSLDTCLQDQRVVIAFDGDATGATQSTKLACDLYNRGIKDVHILILKDNADPTDFSYYELGEMLTDNGVISHGDEKNCIASRVSKMSFGN